MCVYQHVINISISLCTCMYVRMHMRGCACACVCVNMQNIFLYMSISCIGRPLTNGRKNINLETFLKLNVAFRTSNYVRTLAFQNHYSCKGRGQIFFSLKLVLKNLIYTRERERERWEEDIIQQTEA